jgi:hypothetical protein
MGLVESIVGQEGPLMAYPCSEEQMTLINDVGMNDWLELQEQAELQELVTSHVEDQQRSVPVATNAGKRGPPKMGPNKQVSRKVPSHHGPANSPKKEYGLGVKNQVTTMDMLKRSDMWIADSGASNHVTFSDKGCRNKKMQLGQHMVLCATQCYPSVSWIYPVSTLTKMEHKWER